MNSNFEHSDIFTVVVAAKKRNHETSKSNSWNLKVAKGLPIIVRAICTKAANNDKIIVGVLEDEVKGSSVVATLTNHFPGIEVISIPSDLPGALITALLALKNVPLESSVLITTADSIQNRDMQDILAAFISSNCDAGIVCFKSTNPRYSYVKLKSNNSPAQVSEKEVISEFATTGTFFFKSSRDFIEAAKWCLVNNVRTEGQFYLSASLNYMILSGKSVEYFEIASQDFIPLANESDFVNYELRLDK